VTAAIGCAPGWRARSDPEEVVHVNVAAFRLCSTLCDERDCVDASCASTRRYACPFALEPGLDRESGCAEPARLAEGHEIVRAVEVERGPCDRPRWSGCSSCCGSWRGGRGCRWRWCGGGRGRGAGQGEARHPEGAVGRRAV